MIEPWVMETGITFANWNGLTVRLLEWKTPDHFVQVETMTGGVYRASLEDLETPRKAFTKVPYFDSLCSGLANMDAYRRGNRDGITRNPFNHAMIPGFIPYTLPTLRAAYVKGYYNGRGWSF